MGSDAPAVAADVATALADTMAVTLVNTGCYYRECICIFICRSIIYVHMCNYIWSAAHYKFKQYMHISEEF